MPPGIFPSFESINCGAYWNAETALQVEFEGASDASDYQIKATGKTQQTWDAGTGTSAWTGVRQGMDADKKSLLVFGMNFDCQPGGSTTHPYIEIDVRTDNGLSGKSDHDTYQSLAGVALKISRLVIGNSHCATGIQAPASVTVP